MFHEAAPLGQALSSGTQVEQTLASHTDILGCSVARFIQGFCANGLSPVQISTSARPGSAAHAGCRCTRADRGRLSPEPGHPRKHGAQRPRSTIPQVWQVGFIGLARHAFMGGLKARPVAGVDLRPSAAVRTIGTNPTRSDPVWGSNGEPPLWSLAAILLRAGSRCVTKVCILVGPASAPRIRRLPHLIVDETKPMLAAENTPFEGF